MVQVNNVNHLVLERVGEILGEEFVISATDLDQVKVGRIGAGAAHTLRISDPDARETPLKIHEIEFIKEAIQFCDRWELIGVEG